MTFAFRRNDFDAICGRHSIVFPCEAADAAAKRGGYESVQTPESRPRPATGGARARPFRQPNRASLPTSCQLHKCKFLAAKSSRRNEETIARRAPRGITVEARMRRQPMPVRAVRIHEPDVAIIFEFDGIGDALAVR